MNSDKPNAPKTLKSTKKRNRSEYMAKYYAKNKDDISARQKAARLARREDINATAKDIYATDPTVREQRKEKNAARWKAYMERINADPEAKNSMKINLPNAVNSTKNALQMTPNFANSGKISKPPSARNAANKKQREMSRNKPTSLCFIL